MDENKSSMVRTEGDEVVFRTNSTIGDDRNINDIPNIQNRMDHNKYRTAQKLLDSTK
jgi:hypothetical protein